MPQQGGGGGGGDDDGDEGGGGEGGKGGGDDGGPDWLDIAPDWLTGNKSALTALAAASGTLLAFANDPVGFTRDIIETIIFEDFLFPVAVALWDAGFAVLDSLVLIFFGSDGAIGHTPGTKVGFLDLPDLAVDPVVAFVGAVGGSFTGPIGGINQEIAASVEPLGLAASPTVTALWAIEIGTAIWGGWVLINLVDVPFVRVMATLRAATGSIRKAAGGLLR